MNETDAGGSGGEASTTGTVGSGTAIGVGGDPTAGGTTTGGAPGDGGAAGAEPLPSAGAAGQGATGAACQAPLLVVEDDVCVGTGYEVSVEALADDSGYCQMKLPEPPSNMGLVFDDLELVYEAAGQDREVPRLGANEDCASAVDGGWFLSGSDANGDPTHVRACPCTCSALVDVEGVEVRLGCDPGLPIE